MNEQQKVPRKLPYYMVWFCVSLMMGGVIGRSVFNYSESITMMIVFSGAALLVVSLLVAVYRR